jgi:hypothetical protein
MIRQAAAVAFAVVLSPCVLYAQSTEFTVRVQSAAVRKAPSTASPVVGQAPRGTVLEVTRDIGAWVKVTWPEAADGIGYVHQSMGSLARRSTIEERVAAAFPADSPGASTAAAAAGTTVPAGPNPVPMSTRTMYVAPPTHFVGLGARLAGTTDNSMAGGFGVTSRVWSRKRFGIQLEASRSTLKSDVSPERVTSLQLTPSAIYSLPDRVTDYVWLRPYLGAGVPFFRSTLKNTAPDAVGSVTDNAYGLRTFGGAELTFASVPRFAVSADLGYLWSQTSFAGFERDGLGFSLSGHWYFK